MSISRWFKKTSFTQGPSDETKPKEAPAAESSPLSEPPSSFVFDQLSPSSEQDADAQLRAAIFLSAQESASKHADNESFQTLASEGTTSSQRVIKNGKETVISSDGEDTDSDDFLEDPASLFTRGLKNNVAKAPAPAKPVTSPKKWKYNLDALVHDAVDDNEVEATVHRFRSNMSKKPSKGPTTLGTRLDENRLIEALGHKEDGPQPHRVLNAIRRTNALDYDRNWLFFDGTQTLPPAPEFPHHICPPGSTMEILSNPGARERLIVSGDFIPIALSKGLLSDDIVMWMFHSIPYERRDEISNAYCRVIKSVDSQRLGLMIRRADVDEVFERLGARKSALDPSHKIAPMSHHEITNAPKLTNHVPFVSVLKMFREIISSLAEDTREHVILLLLRMAVDSSLTADPVVSSELQWTIDAVLDPETFSQTDPNDALRRVCSTFYNTVDDVCIQSRIGSHILPSSPWLAQLRCRLAISFLLQSSDPLSETPETLLDLNRITNLLAHDERFQVKRFQGKADYDWRELMALAALLSIVIDSSALEVNYRRNRTEKDFNADIDKLASQIKNIYCSIQVSGASHMTLTLARGDLEALHYRILYSVRSKPPQKKTLFESHVNDNEDIRNMWNKYVTKDAGDTGIPIR
ncbi:hypothetical protein MYU51_001031 [Penicillium brevicompactum]|uniref:uncharacterized protein n=1 Tax=Penicillium brevicompactum TaxID=5074 RepID=UPI00253F689F|nr:uncharacterized protein N7506_009011 [Penicillium brevicompactum]KAJ5325909.1 hypothetical protein N7506_009011 [Penicillium brevicompactum]